MAEKNLYGGAYLSSFVDAALDSLSKIWRTPSTSLVVSSDIFGRKKDKEEIIKLLFDDTCHAEAPVPVIPIWGMGGIGKTTLAQLVYSDAEVVEKFNTRAWVCVAENFDPVGLTRTILQKISPASSVNTNDFDSLQTRLKEELTGKTFLVVLDDVWEDKKDKWEDILKPFRYGNRGSKILLTTRGKLGRMSGVLSSSTLRNTLFLTGFNSQLPLSSSSSFLIHFSNSHHGSCVLLTTHHIYHLTPEVPVLVARASPGNGSATDDEDGVSLGTMKLPLDIDLQRFDSLLFQVTTN
ncbi:hypothetical protein PIB30_020276 [Stylosanthes scabra]|uniref:NB-ARC domain-containing protein n=1 Tax=Stylosanthes scabra TaxID=79078 RepID=A0ABU6U8W5_9FABA|nr:hypothetical protein [Stylosanthes scabra]